jgi:Na+-translocating ferredoxin:NAD+ oxidoreductase subunit B
MHIDVIHILEAFASVSTLGILFGVGLSLASRALAVKKDDLLEKLEHALPGLNCGACGFAGCASYAGELVGGEAAVTLCTPGGSAVAEELAGLLGKEVEAGPKVKMVTQVHCRGGKGIALESFSYNGIEDCNALYLLYGGNKVCKFGCLGKGSCVRVCPVDAIAYDDIGLVWVDKDKCISCGKCVDVCPTGVMQWLPYNADRFVACNSTDKGPVVRKYCKVGCIGCKICARKSPEGGFVIENFLARVDFEQTGEREQAAAACPTKCIIKNQ